MKTLALWASLIFFTPWRVAAQSGGSFGYQDFPVLLSLQFHSINMPFKKVQYHFRNMGFGVGTEFSYTGKQHLVQQVSLIWYRNRQAGNGVGVYTQAVWRPSLSDEAYSEIKLGAGYWYSFRPAASFKPIQGDWVPVGKQGKGMFALPLGIGLGYRTSDAGWSPFVNYQLVVLSGYNASVPVMPETLIQLGVSASPKH